MDSEKRFMFLAYIHVCLGFAWMFLGIISCIIRVFVLSMTVGLLAFLVSFAAGTEAKRLKWRRFYDEAHKQKISGYFETKYPPLVSKKMES